jgi:hypothetical protein
MLHQPAAMAMTVEPFATQMRHETALYAQLKGPPASAGS